MMREYTHKTISLVDKKKKKKEREMEEEEERKIFLRTLINEKDNYVPE
jgi:hypothetical protein